MKRSLNRNELKYIAIIAMLLDHIGMFFIPVTNPGGCILRVLGRLTAPIMCFFIAEGYFYTKSKKNYGLRLFVFAVISQFAYSFAHYNKWFTWDFNMIFTLFISFLVLLSYDKIKNNILKWITIFVLIVISFNGDWAIIAPLWVLVFWIFRDKPKEKFISYGIISLTVVLSSLVFMVVNGYHWYGELWQLGLFICIPLLLLYNGEKGKVSYLNKWIFYIFYPLHLVILGLINLF
ncbi:MAG: TraX family protein [Clostridiaceae bacterium]